MVPKRLAGMDWIELEECPRAYVAVAAWQRLIGLAWLDAVPDGSGLLIPWCSSVHTFGMRFALDVDFLGPDGRVLRAERAVAPRRLLRCAGATAVLEWPAR
jgi:uncharacterized membrane protein (UPF0127 family)